MPTHIMGVKYWPMMNSNSGLNNHVHVKFKVVCRFCSSKEQKIGHIMAYVKLWRKSLIHTILAVLHNFV